MKTTPRYFSYVWVVAMVMLAALLSACSTTMPIPVAPAATVASMKVEASSSAVTADTAQQRAKPAAGISVDDFVADLIKSIDSVTEEKLTDSKRPDASAKQESAKEQVALTADKSAHTDFVPVPSKKILDVSLVMSATKIGQWSATAMLALWQHRPENAMKQLDDITPAIDEDYRQTGWNITWHWLSKGETRRFITASYLRFENAFVVPEGESLNKLVGEAWSSALRTLPQHKVKMIQANTKIVDGKTNVYGIWYRFQDYTIDEKGKLHNERKITQMEAEKQRAMIAAFSAPLPTVVAMNADKYVIHPINEGEVVEMKPFEVNERTLPKSWITFTLYGVSPKSHEGLITAVVANKVDPEKPVGLAGVKDGMIIRSVNGVDPVGLTADKLNDILVPTSDEFVLEVSERKGSDLIRIAIPVSTFSDAAKRLASKKDAAAAPAATVAATTDP